MKELISIAEIVYSLSLDPEAFGRVSLEALSIGKPVLAYGHGGVREQLERIFPEGLVEPGNVSLAIDRSAEILEDSPRPGFIGDFTLERMLSSTMGVYADVLGQATKRE
jgi:glycosyltransferase involved in cell wall biosynthesis